MWAEKQHLSNVAKVNSRTILQMIRRLGKEINHPDSIYYWAYKNNIPVYCPALTDGSLGDMLYFHTFKNPGLVLDIVADIRSMNDEAMKAPPRKTGVIILGGGMLPIRHLDCAHTFFTDLACARMLSSSAQLTLMSKCQKTACWPSVYPIDS